MVFYIQSSEGAGSGEQLGQITLPQFRGLMLAAKAITTRFPPEKVGCVEDGCRRQEPLSLHQGKGWVEECWCGE